MFGKVLGSLHSRLRVLDHVSPSFFSDKPHSTTSDHHLAIINSIDNRTEDYFLSSDLHQKPKHSPRTTTEIMAKSSKRGRDETDTYEADDFVEDDDGSAPKSKKSKKAAPSSSSKSSSKFFEVCCLQLMDWRPRN
jgi:hypothetical protein